MARSPLVELGDWYCLSPRLLANRRKGAAYLWARGSTIRRGRPALFRRSGASPQHPVWPRKVTCVTVRVALEIILMLGLRLPE
jgi:hypothetical protein